MHAAIRRALAAGAAAVAAVTIQLAPAASAGAESSTLCHYTSSQPVLRSGSSGTSVRQAQCELNWAYAIGHGQRLTIDGSFGPRTRAVTLNFQRCVHLSADGVIGPNTWSLLNFWVRQPGFAC